MAEVLSIRNLSKSYKSKPAIRSISFEVGAGQVFGLLGPNGSGKTTTLGIILGAIRKDAGDFSWFASGRSGQQRKRIGALIEQPAFYPWLSGRANLKITAAIRGLPYGGIDAAIAHVGLSEAGEKTFQQYSLGMKQRLGIAAALLGSPDVLVLDEPTNGVDAQGIFEIRNIIKQFAVKGGSVILASHMLDEVEKVCTHTAILKEGNVLRTGPISSVLSTKGWIEVGADSLPELERLVKELYPVARIDRQEGVIALHDVTVGTGELNAQLAKAGIVVTHLVQRHPSLESQYLQLVTQGSQP